MYPVSGHRNGWLYVHVRYWYKIQYGCRWLYCSYTIYSKYIDTRWCSGIRIFPQSNNHCARVFEYFHNQTKPLSPGGIWEKQQIEFKEPPSLSERTTKNPTAFPWIFDWFQKHLRTMVLYIYMYIINGSNFLILVVTQSKLGGWILMTMVINFDTQFDTRSFSYKMWACSPWGVCFVKMECPLRPGIILRPIWNFYFIFQIFQWYATGISWGWNLKGCRFF